MSEPPLSSAQVRRRLIVMSRHVLVDHWPGEAEVCQLCEAPGCRPFAAALSYLEQVDDSAARIAAAFLGSTVPPIEVAELAEQLAAQDHDPGRL